MDLLCFYYFKCSSVSLSSTCTVVCNVWFWLKLCSKSLLMLHFAIQVSAMQVNQFYNVQLFPQKNKFGTNSRWGENHRHVQPRIYVSTLSCKNRTKKEKRINVNSCILLDAAWSEMYMYNHYNGVFFNNKKKLLNAKY